MDKATISIGKENTDLALSVKVFKSGSRGFHAFGKVNANGKRYQANVLVVEIGSKPKE